jgi:hypothetical protein
MKFRYLGNHNTMTAFGYDFSDGATPDVKDKDAIKRLSANREFEALSKEEKKKETVTTTTAPPTTTVTPEATWPEMPVPPGAAAKDFPSQD